MKRETWITGIGILSCLGEGPKAHWQALADGKVRFDTASYPPYIVHPLPAMSFDAQIPTKATSAKWSRGSASACMRLG
jgi:3-oxoacyl-[acyl-carrier-protein] synthase II